MKKDKLHYYTDQTVVRLALQRLPRRAFSSVIDPAMGEGVFLAEAVKLWPGIKLYGMDLDRGLVAKMRAMFCADGKFVCGDSLLEKTLQHAAIKSVLEKGGFDLVVGNPPFSRWRIHQQRVLRQFRMAAPIRSGRYSSRPCEVLFVEQFVKLCRVGGYIVIVLPNGLLCNPRDRRVREYLLEHTEIQEVIGVPSGLFKGTEARTAVLILCKLEKWIQAPKDRWITLRNLCRRGNTVVLDGRVSVESSRILNRMDYGFYDLGGAETIRDRQAGLKTTKLRDLVKYIAAGHTLYGRRRRFSRRGGLRYLSSKTVTCCGIDYCKELRFVRPGSPMDRPSARVRRHDILFVRVGEGCIGRVVVARPRRDLGIANDCIWIIRIRRSSPYYIALVLQTEYGRMLIERGTQHSTGASSISKKSFLDFNIPLVRREFARPFIEAYKRRVLDLHSEAVARGIRGDGDEYIRGVARAKANLREIVEGLDKMLSGSGNGQIRARMM